MNLPKILKITIFAVLCNLGAQNISAVKTYKNPVIPGDHSDCTLTKIGDDYFTTGSSFNPTPVIYHSRDLVHWEAIAQPVSADWVEYGDKDHAGCWGGQMVKYNNRFWFFFSHSGTMCFTTADQPNGNWSLPTRLKNPVELPYSLGYDNSIFIDDDGKWYLIVKNGQPNNGIVELGKDGQPSGKIYNLSWLNPANEKFPYSWAEGPVMWKENGIYYYSFANDVSGGQKVMRSKILSDKKADWTTPVNFFDENDPGKMDAIFQGPNHSSAPVKDKNGQSWVIHPVWARANHGEWYGQGRQGNLNQVKYSEDGSVLAEYPSNKSFTAPKLKDGGIPFMLPKSDNFSSEKLNPEWSFLGYTSKNSYSLSKRKGWLYMAPRSAERLNTIIKTDAEHQYAISTRVDFTPSGLNDEAGLRLMTGDEAMVVKLYVSSGTSKGRNIVFSFLKQAYRINVEENVGYWLKMVRNQHTMSAFFSLDGKKWNQLGQEMDISKLDSYNVEYNGWCGNRQGLYVKGSTAAYFDSYIYK